MEHSTQEEIERIAEIQNDQTFQLGFNMETNDDSESRSIYVGNVEYATTPEELEEFFNDCGTVMRVTIPANKFKGTPKGYAYVEFENQDAVPKALAKNECEINGRPITVMIKRKNIPGLSASYKAPRGLYRGRGSRRGLGRIHFKPPRTTQYLRLFKLGVYNKNNFNTAV